MDPEKIALLKKRFRRIKKKFKMISLQVQVTARSLMVSDLRSETKGSRFEVGC